MGMKSRKLAVDGYEVTQAGSVWVWGHTRW